MVGLMDWGEAADAVQCRWPVKFHTGGVKFSRAWIDFCLDILQKWGWHCPLLAMGTEMKTRRKSRGGNGFTLTELVVIVCIIAMAVCLFLLLSASGASQAVRRKAMTMDCVNNLKQISLAFREWEGVNGDRFPMQHAATNERLMRLVRNGSAYLLWQTMSNELSAPKLLVCPADKQKTQAVSFTQNFGDTNISYFLNLVASDAYPQIMLCGDDNLTVSGVRAHSGILNLESNTALGWTQKRHGGVGNVAFTDGSVQTMADLTFSNPLPKILTAINRLVIP